MHGHRRPTFRAALLLIAALLIIGGAVVTATAAPGPATDVKTAQYGGTVTPPATSGPCKGVGGEAGAGCQTQYKAYKKARKVCTRKKNAKKRKACLKKLKRDYAFFYGK